MGSTAGQQAPFGTGHRRALNLRRLLVLGLMVPMLLAIGAAPAQAAVDAWWNLSSPAAPTVAVTRSDANATLPANAALAAGTGAFTVTLKTAGSPTITATRVSGTPVVSAGSSAPVTVGAGGAAVTAFTTNPGSGIHGTPFVTQPVVRVVDAFGNAVPGSAVSVTVARHAGTPSAGGIPGTLLGAVSVTASQGIATFAGLAIKGVGQGYRLDAASPGLTGATSAAFDVTPRPITVTAGADSREYDGTTASSGLPEVSVGTLATGDMGAWTQAFDTALPGTGKTLTPAGTVTDSATSLGDTASYAITSVSRTDGSITGTVAYAPATVNIGESFPGQVVTSGDASIQWLSTETGRTVTATMTHPLSAGTQAVIGSSDVSVLTLSNGAYATVPPPGGPWDLALITATVGDTRASQVFRIRVRLPSVAAGTYSGTMLFAITGP